MNQNHGDANDWDPSSHYKNQAVAEGYDSQRFSSFAGRVFHALESRVVRKLFAALPQGALVLDAPCGTGRFAEVLLEQGFRVVGVDVSSDMLNVARRRLRRYRDTFEAKVLDIKSLPKEQTRYDAALCARLLMHLPIDEQSRVLGSISQVTEHFVVFNESIDSPYYRARRHLKALLRNRPPARFPVRRSDVRALGPETNITIVREIGVAPLLSEDVFFMGRVNKDQAHRAQRF